MTRRAFRTTVLTLGLCTLAACVVNIAIDMQKNIVVQTDSVTTAVNQMQSINLNDYPDFVNHKANVKSLDLDSADVTVVTLDATNKATKVNTGTVTLRQSCAAVSASNAEVSVGSLTAFPITAGSTAKLPGTPALDAFLMSQVAGAGTFCVVVNGTIDAAPVHVTLGVTLHASLGYDAGLF